MPDPVQSGDETVRLVEIDQPLCQLVYGVAPCLAKLGTTGARKCFNTKSTCQSPLTYLPGTLTLRLTRPQDDSAQFGPVLPCVRNISTTPTKINLGGIGDSSSPLGQREVVQVDAGDFLHDDLQVDPYRLERATGAASADGVGYDPYERGTFWGKWVARNPFNSAYALRVLEGVIGQALADMRVRHYIIDRIDLPADGAVRITAKDLFSRIEAKKAVAPFASQGALVADLTGTPATFTVTPLGIGSLARGDGGYADITATVHGFVTIGNEIIEVTRAADVFTVVTRAALNTSAEDHKQEDVVQLVLAYVSTLAHNIVYDLLINYSSVPPGTIDKVEWDTAAADLTELFSAHIATPTPVADLIAELEVQSGFTVWPDVTTNAVKFAALRPGAPMAVIDDTAWIVDGSLGLKTRSDLRLSQVWVYYAQKDPTKKLDDKTNFRSRLVAVDLEAESDEQYAAPAIKEIFSRWIPQFGRGFALTLGDRLLTLFRDPPYEIDFSLYAGRAGSLLLGRYFAIEIAEVQDDTGAVERLQLAATQVEQGENEIAVLGQQVAFTPQDASADRVIHIENDVFDVNLRAVHDSLFSPPDGTQVIRFVVDEGVTVGATSVLGFAILSGIWPDGQPLFLDIGAAAKISGAGGQGGKGGGNEAAAQGGNFGGTAIGVQVPITIDNLGRIWGGGGGGGGGGHVHHDAFNFDEGGGGGGGGQGILAGPGGLGGRLGPTDNDSRQTAGAPGTFDTPGDGGVPTTGNGGRGGRGGDPGQPGEAGVVAHGSTSGLDPVTNFAGAAGGDAGFYIVNNFLVTWVNTGDRRGLVG